MNYMPHGSVFSRKAIPFAIVNFKGISYLRLEFEKKAFSLQPKTNKIVKTWVHLEFMLRY